MGEARMDHAAAAAGKGLLRRRSLARSLYRVSLDLTRQRQMSKCGPPKKGRKEGRRGGEAGRQTEGRTTKEILIRTEKTRLRHAGRTDAGGQRPSLPRSYARSGRSGSSCFAMKCPQLSSTRTILHKGRPPAPSHDKWG